MCKENVIFVYSGCSRELENDVVNIHLNKGRGALSLEAVG